MHIVRFISICALAFLLGGCAKDSQLLIQKKEFPLSIKVKNITKRHLYAACFAYMKKSESPRWRWNKTNVYELVPNKEVTILLDTFKSERATPDAYGVLGVFTSYDEAYNAIYELTPDENKIDLDRIKKLQDKTIILGIEKYGVVGDIFDYSFISNNTPTQELPPLNFEVENKTGKDLYVTAFIYEKDDAMPIWHYDKSDIIKINDNESAEMDIDTINNAYDRKYVRGYLAVFDETEKKEAYDATFQLLKSHQIINMGILSALQNRKVILKNQKYGILGDVIDFVSKEPRKISYSKSENIRYQPRYS